MISDSEYTRALTFENFLPFGIIEENHVLKFDSSRFSQRFKMPRFIATIDFLIRYELRERAAVDLFFFLFPQIIVLQNVVITIESQHNAS